MFLKTLTLHRFFGFSDFTVEFGDATVLVGPNNGGKTSILRAVQFSLDAFRALFGSPELHEPNLERVSRDWRVNIEPIGKRLGIDDRFQLYFERTGQEEVSLDLTFSMNYGEVSLQIRCQDGQALDLDGKVDGESIREGCRSHIDAGLSSESI